MHAYGVPSTLVKYLTPRSHQAYVNRQDENVKMDLLSSHVLPLQGKFLEYSSKNVGFYARLLRKKL